MLRGILAVLVGFAIVTALPTYGGIGFNILFYAADRGIPQQGSGLYGVVGIYAMLMTVLLVSLGILLITEFTNWNSRYTHKLVLPVLLFLLLLSLVHVAAFLDILRIGDSELKRLFVDSSIFYAASIIVAALLFAVIHWTGRSTDVSAV